MPTPETVLLIPPHREPFQASLGAARLAAHLRTRGYRVSVTDLSLEAFRDLTAPGRLQDAATHVRAALDGLEAQPALRYQGQFQYRRLARALLAAPAVTQEGAGAIRALQSADGDWETAHRHLRRALELLSAEYFPAQWSWNDYHLRLAWQDSVQALTAVTHPSNLFLPYMRTRAATLCQTDEIWIWCETGRQLIPALTLAYVLREHSPALAINFAGPLTAHLNNLTENVRGLVTAVVTDAFPANTLPDYDGFPLAEYLTPFPFLACPGTADPGSAARLAARHPGAVLELTGALTADELAAHARALAAVPSSPAWAAEMRQPPAEEDAADLARLLRRSGCCEVAVMLPATAPRVRTLMGLDPDLHPLLTWLQACRVAGLPVRLKWQVGYPTETHAEGEATGRFLAEVSSSVGAREGAVFSLEQRGPEARDLLRRGLITSARRRRDWDPNLHYEPSGGMSPSEALELREAIHTSQAVRPAERFAPSRAHSLALADHPSARQTAALGQSPILGPDSLLIPPHGLVCRQFRYNLPAIEALVYERDTAINRLLDQPGVDVAALLERWEDEIPACQPEPQWVGYAPQRDRVVKLTAPLATLLNRFDGRQPAETVAKQAGVGLQTLLRAAESLVNAGLLLPIGSPVT